MIRAGAGDEDKTLGKVRWFGKEQTSADGSLVKMMWSLSAEQREED